MQASQQLVIKQQLNEVHQAVDALQDFAVTHKLDSNLMAKMRQAVVEWLNNVIEHGQSDAQIEIEFLIDDSRFRSIVRDNNPSLPDGFILSPRIAPDPTDLPEGGWGMLIIQAMVDQLSLQTHPDGNTMQLSVFLIPKKAS